MKNLSKNKTATAIEPSWMALNVLHGVFASHQARRYAVDQSLCTYMAPTLCATDGEMLNLEVISHPELVRRYPELGLVEAMARYTKGLLTVGHPALRQFVKRHGFAPNVVMHVAECTVRQLVAVDRLPAASQVQLCTDVVMTAYYTRTRNIGVTHPLVQVEETGLLAMEPQPFPAEGTETVCVGGLGMPA